MGDLVGGRRRADSEDDEVRDPFGVGDRPSSARIPPIEPPTTACHDSIPRASVTGGFSCHLIAHRDHRKARSVGTSVRGEGRGTGGALSSAKHVRSRRRRTVRIDREAGADKTVPPTRRRVTGAGIARRVRVAGQRVLDEHGIRALRIQFAPRLVSDGDLGR